MKTPREMIDNLIDLLGSGHKLEDIQKHELAGITLAKANKIEEETTPTNEGEGVRFPFFDHYEAFYMHFREKTRGSEEWTKFGDDNLIYQTAKSMRAPGEEQFNRTDALAHELDVAVKRHDVLAYMALAKGTHGVDGWQMANAPASVRHIFYPRKYEGDKTAIIDGETWLFASDKANTLQDGWSVGPEVEGFVLYHTHPSGAVKMLASNLHDSEGMIQMTGSLSKYAAVVGMSVSGGIIREVDGPSVEDKAAYKSATDLLASVKSAAAGDEKEKKRLENAAAHARGSAEEYIDRLSNAYNELRKAEAALARIQIPKDVHRDYLVTTVKMADEISEKPPVKSIEMIDGGFRIALHPCTVDCGEQENYQEYIDAGSGKEYLSGRGMPSYRYLPNLEFELKLKGTSNPNAAIKWLLPKVLPEGQTDNRCHPHIQYANEGRACWGEAAAPLAGELSSRSFADALDWVFAWVAGIRRDDHIVKSWQFAPSDKPLGWDIPEEVEEVVYAV